MSSKTLVGFGFGPIQSGLFVYEAARRGNFSRLVVAEVDQSMVDAVRANDNKYQLMFYCHILYNRHNWLFPSSEGLLYITLFARRNSLDLIFSLAFSAAVLFISKRTFFPSIRKLIIPPDSRKVFMSPTVKIL